MSFLEFNLNEYLTLINQLNVSYQKSDVVRLTEIYRGLRNFCSNGRLAQIEVAQHDPIKKTIEVLQQLNEIKTTLGSKDEEIDVCSLVALQFLANFQVDNKAHQNLVWAALSPLLFTFLQHDNLKIQNCVLMILYNTLMDDDDLLMEIQEPLKECILQKTRNEITALYATFILELLICKTSYIEDTFMEASEDDKVLALDVISGIQNFEDTRTFQVGLIRCLADYFVDKSSAVLAARAGDVNERDAALISTVLDLINRICSSQSHCLTHIQAHSRFFIHSIGLLKSVHALSKEKGNQFSMLLKMSDVEQAEIDTDLQSHPAFGFKAALVRLVGNLCYRHKENQDTAREMGAIPLIMDCCNIDARNPLIIQWAVLAMRNLCEENLENQRVVACVDRRGEVDSKRLADLGIHLNGSH